MVAYGKHFWLRSNLFLKEKTMKPLLLIVNPCSGTCQGAKRLGEIVSVFQNGGYLPTVLMTQKSGDATAFAKQWAPDFPMIVCVGGDGTFSETMAGLLASGAQTKIGYIPAGSTNDLASTLKLSGDPTAAAQAIVDGKGQMLDVGSFNERYFAYTASFGVFTKTSYATPQDLKNTLGYLAYVLEGIRDLATIQPVHMQIDVNGEQLEGDYIFGAVSNSTSLGGILQLDTAAVDLNDGLLELLLIKMPATPIELAKMIHALHTKQYDSCESIRFLSTQEIRIRTDGPGFTWTLDGEPLESGQDTRIINVHDAYRIIL